MDKGAEERPQAEASGRTGTCSPPSPREHGQDLKASLARPPPIHPWLTRSLPVSEPKNS